MTIDILVIGLFVIGLFVITAIAVNKEAKRAAKLECQIRGIHRSNSQKEEA